MVNSTALVAMTSQDSISAVSIQIAGIGAILHQERLHLMNSYSKQILVIKDRSKAPAVFIGTKQNMCHSQQ